MYLVKLSAFSPNSSTQITLVEVQTSVPRTTPTVVGTLDFICSPTSRRRWMQGRSGVGYGMNSQLIHTWLNHAQHFLVTYMSYLYSLSTQGYRYAIAFPSDIPLPDNMSSFFPRKNTGIWSNGASTVTISPPVPKSLSDHLIRERKISECINHEWCKELTNGSKWIPVLSLRPIIQEDIHPLSSRPVQRQEPPAA